MLRLRLSLLALALCATAHAQPAPLDVPSQVAEVTVYLQGARVTRTGAINLPAGASTLRFAGLPDGLDPQSIQLGGEGDVALQTTTYHRTYTEDQALPPAVERLQAEEAALQDSLEIVQARLEVFQIEEQVLMANRTLGEAPEMQTVAALRARVDFFRERLTELKLAQRVLRKRTAEIQERLEAVRRQIAEIYQHRSTATGAVIATVTAPRAGRRAFTLHYTTLAAGWHPHYDVRVEAVGRPLTLAYKANVYQSTGEEWGGVQLTLSTGNPAEPGTRPTLSPWYLRFEAPPRSAPRMQMEDVVVTGRAQEAKQAMDQAAPLAFSSVQTQVRATTVTFEVEQPFTLPSDGLPRIVQVAAYDLPAAYAYYAVPKLSPDAYLTASLTEWSDLPLLPGEANLFLEGDAVGTSYLDPVSTADTLVVSLGRDDGVVVQRRLLRDRTERNFFGSRQTNRYAYEVEVRNQKGIAIDVIVEDQVPVSTDEAIDVKAEWDGEAVLEKDTGVLRWRLTLQPGESARRTLRYDVTFPRGRRITL